MIQDVQEQFTYDGCLILFFALSVMNFKEQAQDEWIQFVNDFEDAYLNASGNIPKNFFKAILELKTYIAKNVLFGDRSIILRTKDLLIQFPKFLEKSSHAIRYATMDYLNAKEKTPKERLRTLHRTYRDFKNKFATFMEEIHHLFGILHQLLQLVYALLASTFEKTGLGKTTIRQFQEYICTLQLFIETSNSRLDRVFTVPTTLRIVLCEPELVRNIREDVNAIQKKQELRVFKHKLDTIINDLRSECTLFNIDYLIATIDQLQKSEYVLHTEYAQVDQVDEKLELIRSSLSTSQINDITGILFQRV
jgi:hypothetical protein